MAASADKHDHGHDHGAVRFALLVAAVFVVTIVLGLLVLGPMEPGGSRTVLRLERPGVPMQPQLPDPSKLIPQVV
jgi:hypothetical protein